MADHPGGNQQASGSAKDLAQLEEHLGGKYRVLKLLGRGGFGSVYLVEIAVGMVGQKLALKLLGNHLKDDDDRQQGAINEIRVAMRLVDKYIIQIRDVGVTDDGQLYYTMDYSPGVTLRKILKIERRIEIPRAILLLLRVLRALKTAHAHGVIHRDLKPENIMVEKRGDRETVRVLDFGIATAVGEERSPLKKRRFIGSPYYVPPEQFLDEKLGFYTDLYAAGVVLYECITGERPYHGATAREVFEDMKSRPVLPPDQFTEEIAQYPGLNELIVKVLERNPERRYQSASELFKELETFVDKRRPPDPAQLGRPTAARASRAGRRRRVRQSRHGRTPWLGIGVVIILLVIAAVYVIRRGKQSSPLSTSVQTEDDDTNSLERDNLEADELEREAEEDAAKDVAAKLARTIREGLDAARIAFDANDWSGVRDRCDEALVLDPENGEAFRLRGLAELKMGLFNESERTLQLAIDHGDGVPRVATYVALAEAKIKMTPPARDEAKSALWQLFYEHPRDSSVVTMLVRVLDEEANEEDILAFLREVQGRTDLPAIKELYQKWRVTRPAELRAAREKAIAQARQAFDAGDWEAVIAHGLDGYEANGTTDMGLKLSVAYRELGRFPESVELLRQLALQSRENSGSLALVALLFGETYLRYFETTKTRGHLEDAQLNFTAVVTLCEVAPDVARKFEARARTFRARCWAYASKLDELQKDIKAARAIGDGDRGFVLAQARAFVLLATKTEDAADRVTAYRRAISRFGRYHRLAKSDRARANEDGWAYYEHGLCYLKLARKPADYREANNCFSRAKKAGLKTAELYAAWGEAAFKRGAPARAAEYYRESYTLKASIAACYFAAAYFAEADNSSAARRMLERGIADFSGHQQVEKLKELLERIGPGK